MYKTTCNILQGYVCIQIYVSKLLAIYGGKQMAVAMEI